MNSKSILSLTLAIMLLFSTILLSSCNNSANEPTYFGIVSYDNQITYSPYSLQYNADGTMTLVVAVVNKTQFSKILTNVDLAPLVDQNNFELTSAVSLSLDEKKYVDIGETTYFEYIYEAEEVKMKKTISSISLTATPTYLGCVHNGAKPDKSDADCYTMSVTNGEITDTLGFEGTICIRNNYKTDKKISSLSFDILSDTNAKLNTNIIDKDINDTIKAGEMMTVKISLNAKQVNQTHFAESNFNMLYIRNVEIKE